MATTTRISVFTLTPIELETQIIRYKEKMSHWLTDNDADSEMPTESANFLGNILGIAYQPADYPFQIELLGFRTEERVQDMRDTDAHELGLDHENNFIVDFEDIIEADERYAEQIREETEEDEPARVYDDYESLAFISGLPIDYVTEKVSDLEKQFRDFRLEIPEPEDFIIPGDEDACDGAHLSCTMGESEDLEENREGIYVPIKRRKLFHFSAKADAPKEAVEIAGKLIGVRQMSTTVTSEQAGIDQQEDIGRQAVVVHLNDEFSRLGPDCTIENICDRFYPVDSFTWTVTDAVFAIKYNKGIVETLLNTNLPFVGVLRHHLNLIASFEVEIRYNSYPQALGMMFVGTYPNEVASLVPTVGNDTFTLLPHSKLSAGYETVQELKVSLFMETNYLQLSTVAITQRHDARIIAMVWNALVVAAGMPNQLTAHIWIKPKMNSATKTTYRTIIEEIGERHSAGQHEGLLNTVLNGVGAVAEAIPLVSTIVKGVAGIVGLFDKPSVYREDNSIGLTDIPIKVNTSRQVQDQSGSFEHVMEPLTLRKYLSTPCRIRTTAWPAAAASDVLLFSQEVSLAALPAFNPVAETAKGFTLWRGTLCYAFEIVGTRFHQGQLMVSVTYRNAHGTVPTNAQARETYMFTVDIGKNNFFCIEVPHVYPHDWRSVRNEATQYTTPIITVWVQNPLAAPSIVGNVVYINTYFNVGDDFEFNGQKHKAEPTTEEGAWEIERVTRRVFKAGEDDLNLYAHMREKNALTVDASAQELFDDAMEKWNVSERMRLDWIEDQVREGRDRDEVTAANQPRPRPTLRFFVDQVRLEREAQRRWALMNAKTTGHDPQQPPNNNAYGPGSRAKDLGDVAAGCRQSMGAPGETHAQTGQETCWSPFKHSTSPRLGGSITHIETYRRRGISVAEIGVTFATSAKIRVAILPLYPTNTGAGVGTADRYYNCVTAGFRTGCGRWLIRTDINKMQSIRFVTQNRYVNDLVSRDGSFIPVDDPFFVVRAENGVTETVANSEGYITVEIPMITNNPIMALNGDFSLNRAMSVALYAIAQPGSANFRCSIYYIPGDDERFYFMLPMVPGPFSIQDRSEIVEDDEARGSLVRRNPIAVSGANFVRGSTRHVHLELYGDGIPRVTMNSDIETNCYGQTEREAAEVPVDEVPHMPSGIGLWQSVGRRQMGTRIENFRVQPVTYGASFQALFAGIGPGGLPLPEEVEGEDDEEADNCVGRLFSEAEQQAEEEDILYSVGILFGVETFNSFNYVWKTHIRNVLQNTNNLLAWRYVFRTLNQVGVVTDFIHLEVSDKDLEDRMWWRVEYLKNQEYLRKLGDSRQFGDRWFEVLKEMLATVKDAIPELKKLQPLAEALAKFGVNAEKWVANLWKSVKLIFDHVFPIITALYTAFTAPAALSVIAIAQLCYHLHSLIPEGKAQDPDTLLDVKYDHFSEEPVPAARQMGALEDLISCGDAAATGLSSLTKIISEFGGGLVACVSRSFGYAVGPGYARYMRRRKEEVGPETLFERCVRIFFDSILYALYGNSMNIEWERKRIVAVTEIVHKFQADLLAGRFTGKQMDAVSVDGNKTNLERLRWYYSEAKKAMYLESELRLSPLVSRQIGKIFETLCECERVKRTKTMQPEPVGVYFGGKPGTGKSLLVSNYLPRFLLHDCGLPCDDSCMYTIPTGEQEFWDNYNQQPYAYVDEFLQESKGADALKVVQMISSSKWAINMASLEQKGMTFESRFIAASSNLTSVITATEIADQSALVRRFPFAYELRIQDGYDKNGKVNYSKLIADVDRCLTKKDFFDLMDQVWHFHRLDLLTGKFEEGKGANARPLPPLLFSTVLNLLKAEYELRTSAFVSMEKKIDELLGQRQMFRRLWKGKQDCPEPAVSCEARTDRVAALFNCEDDEICNNNYAAVIEEEIRALCGSWIGEGRSNDDFYRQTAKEWIQDVVNPTCLRDWCNRHDIEVVGDLQDFCTMVDEKKPEPVKKGMNKWIGILAVMGILGLKGVVVYYTIKSFRGIISGMHGVVQSYTGTTVSKTSRLAKQLNKNAKPQHLQMGNGDVVEKIRRNIRLMRSRWTDSGSLVTANVHTLWIDDRHCVIPAHFVDIHFKNVADGCNLGTEMLFGARGEALSWETIIFDKTRILPIDAGEYKDSYLYRSPVPIESVRNILPLVCSAKAKTLDFAHNGALLAGGDFCVDYSGDIDCSIGTYDNVSYYDEKRKVHTVRTAVAQLETRTIDGDCGRPYVLNSSFNAPIVGIHSIYLSNGTAGMCIINREAIEAARKQFQDHYNDVTLEDEDVKIDVGERNSRFWNSPIELVGKVTINDFKITHNSPCNTALVPLSYRGRRLVHEDWNVDFLPAAQRIITTPEGVKVHPLITNAQKYDVKYQTLLGDTAMAACINNFVDKIPPRFSRILTLDEAINGTADGLTMPLKMDTSCGYWGNWFKDGKKQIFEEIERESDDEKKRWRLSARASDCVVPIWNCSFDERLLACEEMLREGVVPCHLWIATTKDELRPRAKVLYGKTRVFEQPGLEYVLLSRKYFGDFLGWYKDRAGFTFYHGIGKDKEEVWGAYLKGFAECGSQGHAFDYSNWDGSVPPQAFEFFLAVTDHFYSSLEDPKARVVRHGLVRMLRNGLHVMNDQCYRTRQGNKSGNPFTDVFNSVCNTWVMYSSWMLTKLESGLEPSLADFDDKVRMLTYGDDLMMTVRPDALNFFSGPKIRDACARLGLTITDAKKSGVIPDFVSFRDMTFLKSSFVAQQTRFGSVILSPMPEEDILKELTHCPKSVQGNDEDLRQRISNTQRFMAHHGKAKLEHFQQQLRDLGIPKAWIDLTWDAFCSSMKEKQSNASIF